MLMRGVGLTSQSSQLDRKVPATFWSVLLIQGPQLQSSQAGGEGHHSNHLHHGTVCCISARMEIKSDIFPENCNWVGSGLPHYNCFIMSYSTELTDIKIGVSRKHFYSLNWILAQSFTMWVSFNIGIFNMSVVWRTMQFVLSWQLPCPIHWHWLGSQCIPPYFSSPTSLHPLPVILICIKMNISCHAIS